MTSIWIDGTGKATVTWSTPCSGKVAEFVTFDIPQAIEVDARWRTVDIDFPHEATHAGECVAR